MLFQWQWHTSTDSRHATKFCLYNFIFDASSPQFARPVRNENAQGGEENVVDNNFIFNAVVDGKGYQNSEYEKDNIPSICNGFVEGQGPLENEGSCEYHAQVVT